MKQVSEKMKLRLKSYNEYISKFPSETKCAACGGIDFSNSMESHHPAGRSKSTYNFVFKVHTECHRKIHNNAKWAEENNLLMKNRNSKVITKKDMRDFVMKNKYKPTYSLKNQ